MPRFASVSGALSPVWASRASLSSSSEVAALNAATAASTAALTPAASSGDRASGVGMRAFRGSAVRRKSTGVRSPSRSPRAPPASPRRGPRPRRPPGPAACRPRRRPPPRPRTRRRFLAAPRPPRAARAAPSRPRRRISSTTFSGFAWARASGRSRTRRPRSARRGRGPPTTAERGRRLLERRVPGGVTEAVVHVLEAVEVEHHHDDPLPRLDGRVEDRRAPRQELPPVGEPRERVRGRVDAQALHRAAQPNDDERPTRA